MTDTLTLLKYWHQTLCLFSTMAGSIIYGRGVYFFVFVFVFVFKGTEFIIDEQNGKT